MRITTNKNRTCESIHDSDAAAVDSIRSLVESGALADNEFACRLARARHLSSEQRKWCHILSTECHERAEHVGRASATAGHTPCGDAMRTGEPTSPDPGVFNGIVELLDMAHESLKYPKVRLVVDGGDVVLARAGDKSRRPGVINITDGRPYGANTWYGRIERDGAIVASRSITDAIVDELVRLSADPAKVAAGHGKLTGSCCFCGKSLETDESLAVGYGPTCAKNYKLPWGAKVAPAGTQVQAELGA